MIKKTELVRNRRVLVYGLGVTGQSACETLLWAGAEVCLYADPPANGWSERDLELRARLAEAGVRVFEDEDEARGNAYFFILKSPGIRRDRPLLQWAREQEIEIWSDLEVAYRLFGGERMLAITGSNGKTTTTSLLTHLLNQAGRRAMSVGNIGIGILAEMRHASEDTLFVVECSSFQLASVSAFAPHIAAILNITPDHLDWHESFEEYALCKSNVARAQQKDDVLILNPRDVQLKRFAEQDAFPGRIEWIDGQSDWAQRLRTDRTLWHLYGEHNVENALFAIRMAQRVGLTEAAVREGLSSFRPVAHRVEFVREFEGVRYINDSKATNVDAAAKALSGMDAPVLLIAGGMDKHVPFDDLYQSFAAHGKKMILLGETKHQIAEGARTHGLGDCVMLVENMAEAVRQARAAAEPGDIVLLSPASASWDMYPSYEVRGDEFRSLVNELK